MRTTLRFLVSSLGLGLAVAGLSIAPAPAQAAISTKISAFPYVQDWSGLTGTSTWADFQGVEGFSTGTSIAPANQPNSTDVGTLTSEGTLASNLVMRTGTSAPNTDSNGGVLVYPNVANKTVALSATSGVTTPLLVFHLDTTGESGIGVAYDVQDLDSSTDDQPQRVALQYRVGTSGAYTNVPEAYVADATTASNTTVGSTSVSAVLPAAVDNQSDVFVRVITIDNATGSNEHVGIDNINITTGETSEPDPLTATDPGDKTYEAGQPIPPITLQANGGTGAHTWQTTTLPAGLTLTGNQITGTPTTVGSTTVTATVTDSASPAATATAEFVITVNAAAQVTPIHEIQGTGARSPFAPATGNGAGDVKTVEGIVTALYRTGGFNGMFVQTAGTGGTTDATPGASDALFVFGGSNAANIPAGIVIGDSVRVTGPVSEFFDSTQITPTSTGVTELGSPLAPVTALEVAYPTTNQGREAHEGMLVAPTDTFTVTNTFQTNGFAEIGLATGDVPLKQPTEFAAPGDTAGLQAVVAENAERAVTLDDGATTNYLQNQTTKAIPLPWLTGTSSPPRVGAEATFQSPVILDWRNSIWKLQPRSQVTDSGSSVVTFENTRATNQVPQDVGGDISIATFNVLNYFNTTGEAYAAAGPQQNPPLDTFCTYFTDRQSNRIGNDSCGVRLLDDPDTEADESDRNDGRGPRGAATTASLARQEEKLVNTINALDASVIALEEMENSIKLPGETNRDEAVAHLVQMLNADAGSAKWKYVRSPGEALDAGPVAEQDVIRPAFIYQPALVAPVGQSDILFGTTEFANAREPLAQAFKAAGAPNSDAFAVIVNHFKSKGDNANGVPPATGDNANDPFVGAFNGDRVRQAERLVQFADDFAAARDIEAVFLAGDFNSYTMEEPIQELEAGGFELIESNQPDEESYSFSGLSGSLDHVLGNTAAMDLVTGADIWEINANESVAYQYSRYNYNATILFDAGNPFATSDHNPEIVGLDVPDVAPTTTKKIQVVGTNDFHGRLLPDAGNAAGAAPFATAINELRAEHPNTIFAAAGDLIGASTFESFVQDDEPTIEALNAMDLEVSAAGNHEFDRGYEDFVGRVQDLAEWEYIATNVDEPGDRDDLAETWTTTIDGVDVGFVGAVTEDLPALVNPAGIEGVTVTDIVDSTNAAAEDLREAGADIVVLLVHEGSPSTDCQSESFTDPATVWGNIVQNTSGDVDAIISGHTHLAYNCRYPVSDWVTEGRAVTRRPVVSAGQYGTNLNQLVFNFDTTSGALVEIEQDVIGTAGVGYAPDPTVQQIVDDAVAFAETKGAEVLGQVEGPFKRATYNASSGATENRGGESTLGNLVAEVQRWATTGEGVSTDADIAFMNPGGLRADMLGVVNGAVRDLTYRQAADVQPFANTLVNMELTGAQLETVLEEQWQRTPQGGVPSRPFLRLGVSEGFTYTYTESPVTVTAPNSAPVNTFQGEVTGMWLDGEPIDPAATYSVTVNSFLGSGGDNFREFANGSGKVDTGVVDLQAMVDYMAANAPAGTPLPVDYGQRAVEVTFPNDAPETYEPGDTLAFDVASWSMSQGTDLKDTELKVKVGDQVVGTVPVDNTVGNKPYDNTGTATVSVTIPEGAVGQVTLVGATTGSQVPVAAQVEPTIAEIQIIGTNDFHGRILQNAGSREGGAAVLSGAVKQLRQQHPNTVFTAAGDLIGATTFESFVDNDEPTIDALNAAGLEVSAAGNHEFDQGYEDLVGRVQDRADWEYIAANVEEPAGRDDLAETWVKEMDGVTVGFVGAVTEALPSLVSPAGIEGVTVTDIVDATNAAAAQLKADGADVVVLLVHEGSGSTNCASPEFTDPATPWGNVSQNTSEDVDAIISGHTHLAYNCTINGRPVVSAGQYGMNLNQLLVSVDTATGAVTGIEQNLLPLMSTDPDGNGPLLPTPLYPADQAVADIVTAAEDYARPIGARVLGPIQGPFNRAKLSNGTTENRGGESTLGNLVAEVQRAETPEEQGGAEIAFMNPGGLRADMTGTVVTQAWLDDPANAEWAADYEIGDRILTYRQAANVQPFANGLVNMDMTGAQIETVLEQQWQRTEDGSALPPSTTRYFLRLGVSEGFTYTYVETPATVSGVNTFAGEVTGMWLNGEPVDPEASYSVTVNSFLAGGGDNFWEFRDGLGQAQWGITDLQAMGSYMEANTGETPLAVDYSQRAVEVEFPAGAPERYRPGQAVKFDVTSWAMSTSADLKDTEISVRLGGTEIGTATVDNTIGTDTYDQYGKASVNVTLPEDAPFGDVTLTLVGETTGTEVRVPIAVQPKPQVTAADVTTQVGTDAVVEVAVSGAAGVPTGTVEVFAGQTLLGSGELTDGAASVTIDSSGLAVGEHALTVVYRGDSTYAQAEGQLTLTIEQHSVTVAAEDVTIGYGEEAVTSVTVSGTGATPTGDVEVLDGTTVLGTGTLVDGAVEVTLDTAAYEPGTYSLLVVYEGDATHDGATAGLTLTVEKLAATVTGTDAETKYGKPTTVDVTVTTGGDVVPTGTVMLTSGAETLGSATLDEDGTATVTIPKRSLKPSSTAYPVTITYSGDDLVAEATGTARLIVKKGGVTFDKTITPKPAKVGKTHAKVEVTVANVDGVEATGQITVSARGIGEVSGRLVDGTATVRLPVFKTKGIKKITISYSGSDLLKAAETSGILRVVR